MTYIVDASVVAKWFVREELHEEALALLDLDEQLEAPDLIVTEVANTAWRKCTAGEIDGIQARRIAGAIVSGVPRLLPSAGLIERAFEIALTLDHPVYDCLYVACAEVTNSLLITADKRLRRVTRGTELNVSVRRLEEEIMLPLKIPVSRIERVIRVADALRETRETVDEALWNGETTIDVGDERIWEALELERDAPAQRRILAYIDSLSKNERADLLALMRFGREDPDINISDWPRIRRNAERTLDENTTGYMIEKTPLADYLRKGLERIRAQNPSIPANQTNP